ncbi:MAG: hypothetical protein JEY91_05320 [Spirochaetaceae bacterium]|nr:hypothetical protein [Spirochaetaceae bacterium]
MNKIIPFLNNWLSKSGDDTFWSWVITLMYVVTIVFSIYYIQKIKNDEPKHFLWVCISIFLLVLGINKQLDIQILLSMVARFVTKHLGLSEYHYLIHNIVTLSLFVSMITVSIIVLIRIRTIIMQSLIPLSAVTILMVFILLRAASIQIPKIHGLELLGLILIFADICINLHKLKKTVDTTVLKN